MKTNVILFAALLALAAGCKPKIEMDVTLELSAESGGRKLVAKTKGSSFVHPGQDEFVVTLPGHKVVIERERVLLDGTEHAKFPATATSFTLVHTNEVLTVTADGAVVLTAMLGK